MVHSSLRFPLHCAINNLQLNILMICFLYMIHYVCKVAGTMSFYKRTILRIYKFDKTYSFIKLCWYPQIGKLCWYPHSNKLLQKCVIFNKAINTHSRGSTEQHFYVWEPHRGCLHKVKKVCWCHFIGEGQQSHKYAF